MMAKRSSAYNPSSPGGFATTEGETARFAVALPITLRCATRDDLPKLEWYGQYRHYRVVFRRTFAEQERERRLMLVADCSGFPIGQLFIQLHPRRQPGCSNGSRGKDGYLYALRVMEMFRGRGIGTRLLQEAELILTQRGFARSVIAAAQDNPAARRLYERLGYTVVRGDPGAWSYTDHRGQTCYVNEPCWILEKDLPPR